MSESAKLNQRYGRVVRTRRSRVLAWTGSMTGLAALLLVWVLWANPFGVGASIDNTVTSQVVVNDSLVRVGFQLTAQPGRAAACAVEAQDANFTVVGWKIVEFSPSQTLTRNSSVEIRTVRRAVSGLVASCWLL